MKNIYKFMTVGIFAFALGLGFNNFAMSDSVPANYKVAVVDMSNVVSSSKQVMALKKEQQAKLREIQKWLVTAKADIDKQSTKEGKAKLADKYEAEFKKKQEAIMKNYGEKLKAIDNNITELIAKEAKAKNYNMVLTKGAVLYGGEDITNSIVQMVK